ncbi:hypothetical protein NBRC116493_03780 [Aurantivibrio infirmus]
MPIVAIKTESDELLAFLLLNNEKYIEEGKSDCIIMTAPQSTEVMYSKLGDFIYGHRATETIADVIKCEDEITIKLKYESGFNVVFELPLDNIGKFTATSPEGIVTEGKCEIPPPKS